MAKKVIPVQLSDGNFGMWDSLKDRSSEKDLGRGFVKIGRHAGDWIPLDKITCLLTITDYAKKKKKKSTGKKK
jgi:hypothetical protein